MNKVPVLLVEDDLTLAYYFQKILEKENFAIHLETRGDRGAKEALTNKYDLILLDLILPIMNGTKVLKKFREHNKKTPVIVVTDESFYNDIAEPQMESYQLGATLFHDKPINWDLLIVQMKSIIMLNEHHQEASFGKISINHNKQILKYDGKIINTSKKEFSLIAGLMKENGAAVSRRSLTYYTLKGNYEADESSIDTIVSRFRKKLQDHGIEPSLVIETVYGRGYRLAPAKESKT